jgi:hypothetical protein
MAALPLWLFGAPLVIAIVSLMRNGRRTPRLERRPGSSPATIADR